MFTVVIFWQDKKWNDEMECFINNNNEHIGIITLERTEPPKYDTSLNYDELRAKTIENLQKEIASSKARLEDSCARLSKARKVAAKSLQEILKEALEDLNFLAVNFAIPR